MQKLMLLAMDINLIIFMEENKPATKQAGHFVALRQYLRPINSYT